MVNSHEIVVREVFQGRNADQNPFDITIEVEKPVPWGGTSPSECVCWITIDPILRRRDVHGEGPLQALCLALGMARLELELFIEKGGTVSYGDGDKVDIGATWGDALFKSY